MAASADGFDAGAADDSMAEHGFNAGAADGLTAEDAFNADATQGAADPLGADDASTESSATGVKPARGFKGFWSRLSARVHIKQTGRHLLAMSLAVVGSFKPAILRVIGVFIKDPDVRDLVASTLSWVTWGALLLSGMGTLGIDIKPLLSLSTLAGFAISISTKNILADTFSAAYVIWIRPFKRGDRIKVGLTPAYEGEVLSIDYHFVRLKLADSKVVFLYIFAYIYIYIY